MSNKLLYPSNHPSWFCSATEQRFGDSTCIWEPNETNSLVLLEKCLMWITMPAPSLFKFIYLKIFPYGPLQHRLTDTWKSCICELASMGISFEAITFDSDLQWDLEWQLCIYLETNAKQNAATHLWFSHSPQSIKTHKHAHTHSHTHSALAQKGIPQWRGCHPVPSRQSVSMKHYTVTPQRSGAWIWQTDSDVSLIKNNIKHLFVPWQ